MIWFLNLSQKKLYIYHFTNSCSWTALPPTPAPFQQQLLISLPDPSWNQGSNYTKTTLDPDNYPLRLQEHAHCVIRRLGHNAVITSYDCLFSFTLQINSNFMNNYPYTWTANRKCIIHSFDEAFPSGLLLPLTSRRTTLVYNTKKDHTHTCAHQCLNNFN